jgi:hypothetical protein
MIPAISLAPASRLLNEGVLRLASSPKDASARAERSTERRPTVADSIRLPNIIGQNSEKIVEKKNPIIHTPSGHVKNFLSERSNKNGSL